MNADDTQRTSRGIIGAHAQLPGGLLPALHALQHESGFIDRALIPQLAKAFNISDAEVHGVITFYKDFRTTPPRGPIVQVCRAEACQARGGAAVHAAAVAIAEDLAGEAAVEVEEVFCLGLCASGPTVRAGGRLHGAVTAATVGAVIAGIRRSPRHGDEPVVHADPGSDPTVVYVPGDAAACAAGADEVAEALRAVPGLHVVRNGSRGMLWLEPLVEVVTASGRVAYGPVSVADVPALLANDLLHGGDHPLRLGDAGAQQWMQFQQRVTFARVGVVDPTNADDYVDHGGMAGLQRALSLTADEIVGEVTASGLRGRGGAAFPTGIKWRTVLDADGPTKYVVCNADEGDSGTFADRMLIEGDPFTLIEGMIIAGLAVGAHEGYVYVRSEYPDAVATLRTAIDVAELRGWLGHDVLGSGFAFQLHVRVGAGAYICGEETAMLESLEGRRGVVRAKPPLPALVGLFGKPTVVNNVLTFATVPAILSVGAESYAALGVGRSRGTQVFQLAGNIARGGIVETPFGITLRELIDDLGGGTASGRPVRAVQVGGPLGSYLSADQLDLSMDYETLGANDALLGHGGIVVFDDTVDMGEQARFAMEFCAVESCGKCTPCRIGSTRGVELIDKVMAGTNRDENLAILLDLCDVMTDASLCAMGGLTPLPVRSAITKFTDDFHRVKEATT